jgi:antitoxin component YwqK of YwqJK toxin-antitoxin module
MSLSPVPALLLSLLCAACAPRLAAVAVDQGPERIALPDGRALERRVSLSFAGRPVEIFYVYKDTSGNYVKHGVHRHFYDYGQLKFTEQFRDGKLDGVSEFWYENGAKQGELHMAGGKPHGKAFSWYPDGRKQSEKNWVEGRLDGLSVEWDRQGNKTSEILWSRNAIREILHPPGKAP